MNTSKFVKKEGDYWIRENANYPAGEGNLFLERALTNQEYFGGATGQFKVLGGANKNGNKWTADINWCYPDDYDPECGSDDSNLLIVYEGESREEAIKALWDKRLIASAG